MSRVLGREAEVRHGIRLGSPCIDLFETYGYEYMLDKSAYSLARPDNAALLYYYPKQETTFYCVQGVIDAIKISLPRGNLEEQPVCKIRWPWGKPPASETLAGGSGGYRAMLSGSEKNDIGSDDGIPMLLEYLESDSEGE